MARKPFVDPNPTLGRKKLYGPTPASPKAVPEAMAAPKRPKIGQKPAVALIESRVVDRKAENSSLVAPGREMRNPPVESKANRRVPVESTVAESKAIAASMDYVESTEALVRSPIIVRLKQTTIDKLDAVADRGDKSRAELIRLIVEKALR
jgi:hypothetical protein